MVSPRTVDDQVVETPPKRVLRWTEGYVQREKWVSGLGAVFLFTGGAIALFITFWVWYILVGVLLSGFVPLSHAQLMAGAAVAVGAIFVAHWTTDREELERIDVESSPGMRTAVFVTAAAGYGPLGLAFSGRHAHVYVKLLSMLFLIAPQLLTASARMVQRVGRLQRMDVDDCARALTVALHADGKVTFDELARLAPRVDWNALLPMLREMIGVVFLFTPPPGLTVANYLRDEIVAKK